MSPREWGLQKIKQATQAVRLAVMEDLLDTEHHVEVYGDESRRPGRYTVIGGLWAVTDQAVRLRAEIDRIRNMYGWYDSRGELKWRKASGARPHPLYVDLVDLVMSSLSVGKVEFRAAIVDLTNVIGRSRNFELEVLEAWRHLLAWPMVTNSSPDWPLDDIAAAQPCVEVYICSAVRKSCEMLYSHIGVWHHAVSFVESKDDRLLQLADILVGAVGYHASYCHLRTGASPGKVALASRMCYHLARADLSLPVALPPYVVWRSLPTDRISG